MARRRPCSVNEAKFLQRTDSFLQRLNGRWGKTWRAAAKILWHAVRFLLSPPEFNLSSVGGTENVRRRNHSQEKSLQLPVISVTRFSDCSLPLLSALHPSSPLDLNHTVNKNEEFLSKLNHRHHEISTNSGPFVERRLTPTWLLPHHDHAASLEMNSSYDFTSCFFFVLFLYSGV